MRVSNSSVDKDVEKDTRDIMSPGIVTSHKPFHEGNELSPRRRRYTVKVTLVYILIYIFGYIGTHLHIKTATVKAI